MVYDVPVEVFSITYTEMDDEPKLRVAAVPPEEVLVGRDFTGSNLDECDFIGHRTRKSKCPN